MTSYTKSHALIGSCVSSLLPCLTLLVTLPYITVEIFSPVQYLAHRLYNAAASSASHLRSADSLALMNFSKTMLSALCQPCNRTNSSLLLGTRDQFSRLLQDSGLVPSSISGDAVNYFSGNMELVKVKSLYRHSYLRTY